MSTFAAWRGYDRAALRCSDREPNGETSRFACELWLGDGDEPVPGLSVHEMEGSNLLPDAELTDRAQAVASVGRILRELPEIETVLVGDGWPMRYDGQSALAALCDR